MRESLRTDNEAPNPPEENDNGADLLSGIDLVPGELVVGPADRTTIGTLEGSTGYNPSAPAGGLPERTD